MHDDLVAVATRDQLARRGRVAKPTMYPPVSHADLVRADQMGHCWGNFARTGDPDGPGLPTWNKWLPGTATPTQELTPGGARVMASGAYYQEHKCGFWEPLLQQQASP
jgi:para-nitrobenzyl esterase